MLSLEDYKAKKSIEDAQTKRLERQASAERQKVYQDVFLEEMQHYIQYGATESESIHVFKITKNDLILMDNLTFPFCPEPIAGTPPSQSLEDITLEEDSDLEIQLDEFLQNEPDEEDRESTNTESTNEERIKLINDDAATASVAISASEKESDEK